MEESSPKESCTNTAYVREVSPPQKNSLIRGKQYLHFRYLKFLVKPSIFRCKLAVSFREFSTSILLMPKVLRVWPEVRGQTEGYSRASNRGAPLILRRVGHAKDASMGRGRIFTYIDPLKNQPFIWVFPKIVVPQNGWFMMEKPIKMDDLGVPLFLETPI